MSLREKVTEAIKQEICPIPKHRRDEKHQFYYKCYEDNLVRGMVKQHIDEYGRGNGGELLPNGDKPAKMASIASSSAMTFNILGNESVNIIRGDKFSHGVYDVQYEKQMYTLNQGSNPANLDAFLVNRQTREAIFCEMKMLEWLNPPGALKPAYFDDSLYFNKASFPVFSKIIEDLRKPDTYNSEGSIISKFSRYDAWQMLKHTMAIYNYTCVDAQNEVNKKSATLKSMCGQFDKVTLANVVFEMDIDKIKDEKVRTDYIKALKQEHNECSQFINTMLDPKRGLIDLFKRDCNIDFNIIYLPVSEFVSMMDKTTTELAALGRYCCK